MLLDKLEEGFLLLQTRQGLVAVAPSSFWQRAYLVWTFRNFRQLSLPLLNSRQTALINNLFREHPEAVSHRYDPWLVIGVVENFVPPPIEIDATLAAQIDASLAMKAKLPEEVAGLKAVPAVAQVEVAPVAKVEITTAKKEEPEEENAAIEGAEAAPADAGQRSLAPIGAWATSVASSVVTFGHAASSFVTSRLERTRVGVQDALSKSQSFVDEAHGTTEVAAERVVLEQESSPQRLKPDSKESGYRSAEALRHPKSRATSTSSATSEVVPFPKAIYETASRLIASKVGTRRVAVPKLATAIGAAGLCVCLVVAWHRIGAVPGSQAHNSAVQLDSASSSPLPEPVGVAERSTTLPAVTDKRIAGAETAVDPAAVKLASSVAVIAPAAKSRMRVHDAVSSPKLPIAMEDGARAILATRPPLRFVYPAYSGDDARGVVALTAGVDSKGNVRTVKIIRGNRALAAAAVRAVRQWRYRPYMKDGQPVATETNIVITFFSSEAISMNYPPKIPTSR